VGSVIAPGDTAHFEMTRWWERGYDTRVTFARCSIGDSGCGTATSGDQTWTVRIHTSWESASTKLPLLCEQGDCAKLEPTEYNIRLLDPPGTVKQLSAAEADQLARVLSQLCDDNSAAKCTFKPKTFQQTQTDWHIAAPQVINDGSPLVRFTLTRNETESTQTSLKLGVSAKVSIFKIVEAGVSAETTETWTTQKAWTYAVEVQVPHGQQGVLYVKDPIKRLTGDFVATIGNTTWNFTDVNFETPDPDPLRKDGGVPVYKAVVEPLPTPV